MNFSRSSNHKSSIRKERNINHITKLKSQQAVSEKEKACKEMKSIMRDRHSAVYHKSAFSVSPDLNTTSCHQENETMCRICQSMDDSLENQQVQPCACSGSLKYVHMQCLKQWRQTKKAKGADVSICELCKQPYNIELLGNTNVTPDIISKMQEDLRNLVKSGIYLMLLVNNWKREVDDLSTGNIPCVSQSSTNTVPSVTRRLVHRITYESSDDDDANYVTRESLKRESEKARLRRN